MKRKVITREILFDYLHDNSVPVSLPTTKDKLIEQICDYWNLEVSKSESDDVQDDTASECAINSVAVENNKTISNVDLMAEKFAEWFYVMLNNTPLIGDEHFWPDAKLTLNLISGDEIITELAENDPVKIARLLSKTKTEHNLYFNPNISKEGLKGQLDPHGLAVILVCGTLHTNNVCVGVFEQSFSLARDPFSDNNWKIKNSQINLRNKSGVTAYPKLCDRVDSNPLSLTEC